MRKLVLTFAVAVGLLLAACLAAPGEPSSTSASALTCTSSERAFNGACRTMCTTSAQCAGSNTCMTVAGGLSLCLDYKACAYLGGDTECSGVPYGGYNSYGGGYASYDPYWTPTYDPYATSYNGYSSSSEPFGCGGNAVWLSQPPAPSDDPKCGEAHSVVRCKKVGHKCSLVNGTTMDVADR